MCLELPTGAIVRHVIPCLKYVYGLQAVWLTSELPANSQHDKIV